MIKHVSGIFALPLKKKRKKKEKKKESKARNVFLNNVYFF